MCFTTLHIKVLYEDVANMDCGDLVPQISSELEESNGCRN